MNILITGTTGFIGSTLLGTLLKQISYKLVVVLRRDVEFPQGVTKQLLGQGLSSVDWRQSVHGVDTVIHLAARAHVMNDKAADPLAIFRKTNTMATLNLAQQAADVGVKRFIFLSSIKVNGEYTIDKPFTPEEHGTPTDPYAFSKQEAEIGLRQIASETGMEVVIIRPSLVYGPKVKGNFLSMLRWLERGIPLPLGAIHNQRSLVGIDNLVDLIITCIKHPAAANQTFLVSDDEDISTTELLQRMGKALGKPARLIPVSPKLLEFGARLLGKQDVAQRLLGNLQVDISKSKELLGWAPPVSVDEGLRKTAEWYLKQKQ